MAVKNVSYIENIRLIRNIGVIAHIDAGKTTLTERFLYYSGKTHRIGDVDSGNTVMDYLDEERSRGITIVAAAASFPWKHNGVSNLIHLIDTPGHIDFTAEVERSVRVSDGAVVIFSGVEGVEAQSEKVWRQSEKYHVPKIAFINKLDRLGASFPRAFDEIKLKFPKIKAVAFQIPVGIENNLTGVVDLLQMKFLSFTGNDGSVQEISDIPAGYQQKAGEFREKLIEAVADCSDLVAEMYLEGRDIPPDILKKEIRAAVLKHLLCPVFCGSAKKNIGVQPVLEAVCDYLPSPEDRGDERAENAKSGDKVTVSAEDANFCGLVFKLIAGGSADLLYLRIYSGILKFNDTLVNARTRDKVRVKRILRLYSKSVEALEEAGPGDIVGIIGPSKVVTGDTLCSVNKPLLLEKITFPEPVISIAVEPCSGKDKDKLVSSMEILCREDPTLQTKINENTGQHILSGMGELHLDISTRRIEKEFNIHARFGTPQVAFRETIKAAGEQQGVFEKSLGDNEYFAEVKFKLEPVPKLESGIEVASFIKNTDGIPKAWVESALTALDNGLRTGGNWGYPLIYIKASLLHIGGSPDKTTESAVAGAVLNGLQKAVSAGTVLLEPLMNLEITAPENTIGEITGYLQARRAVIHGIENLPESKRLVCEVPLAEMFGFSKALPKLSGGRAGFSMEPCGYQEISEDNLDKLVARGNSVSFM